MSTALPPTISDASVTLSYAGVIAGVSAGQYFGYCTIATVRYEFPNLDSFTDLTPPPAGNSVIAEEITTAAIELQNMLDHYYAMPYTGTVSVILITLAKLNAKYTVANILRHYHNGEIEAASAAAAQLTDEAAAILLDIREGVMRWDAPFGDATARAMLPVYDLSTGATISGSNPTTGTVPSQNPIFSIGRSIFRPDDQY